MLEADSNRVINSAFAENGQGGLRITGSSGNVGGDSLETGNRFEDNEGPGLVVESGTGNAILFNTFVGNVGLAIDLGGDGTTDNDADDPDTGPNNLQNFPALTEAHIRHHKKEPVGYATAYHKKEPGACSCTNIKKSLWCTCTSIKRAGGCRGVLLYAGLNFSYIAFAILRFSCLRTK